jgi:hypothetical protein
MSLRSGSTKEIESRSHSDTDSDPLTWFKLIPVLPVPVGTHTSTENPFQNYRYRYPVQYPKRGYRYLKGLKKSEMILMIFCW